MEKIIYILCSLICVSARSQTNLVPNPSFETYTACPTSIGEIPDSWSTFKGSPDYYNICANSTSTPQVGIPGNWMGYQAAYHGNAYIGLVVYYASDQREFVGCSLTQTLSIGTKYYASVYISRQDTSNWDTGQACSSNKFGFKFSTALFDYANPYPINNSSPIYENSIVYDTLNWKKISGSFIADSAYQYMLIGNFFDNSNTMTSGCPFSNSIAYYYVDYACLSTDSTFCNSEFNTRINAGIINKKINIYPNPSYNFIYIDTPPEHEKSMIILQDTFGKTLQEETLIPGNQKINISNVGNGVFILKIIGKKEVLNYKLIKSKQ